MVNAIPTFARGKEINRQRDFKTVKCSHCSVLLHINMLANVSLLPDHIITGQGIECYSEGC